MNTMTPVSPAEREACKHCEIFTEKLCAEPGFSAFTAEMQIMTASVVSAGMLIRRLEDRSFAVKEGEGYRSGETRGDGMSQAMLVNMLTSAFPKLRILAEEKSNHPAVLDKKCPKIFFIDNAAIVDPTDSTVSYAGEYGTYCVSGGLSNLGTLYGSAIFAPDLNGGFLLVSEKNKGTFITEWDGKIVRRPKPLQTEARESIILFGIDTSLFKNITSLLPVITPNFRAKFDTPSGELGLAMLAAGRASVVVQTPQKAWDWAGGYRAVLENGGIFQFFEIREDRQLVPVQGYGSESFYFDPEHRLGYVAGAPNLVSKVFNLLPKRGWKRIRPDTISGTW